jgi:hypothetical protein
MMLARDLAALHLNATFVVDVKSTGQPVRDRPGARRTRRDDRLLEERPTPT